MCKKESALEEGAMIGTLDETNGECTKAQGHTQYLNVYRSPVKGHRPCLLFDSKDEAEKFQCSVFGGVLLPLEKTIKIVLS